MKIRDRDNEGASLRGVHASLDHRARARKRVALLTLQFIAGVAGMLLTVVGVVRFINWCGRMAHP